jgi:adenosylhomocysteinase
MTISASEELLRDLSWARLQMPLLNRSLSSLPNLKGVKLACSMHLDLKIVPLIDGLRERGADIYLTTCNPSTVNSDVVDHLSEKVTVEAWRDMPSDKQEASFKHALQWKPTHLCEMGADLTVAYHETFSKNVIASLEATRTGLSRLAALNLRYPVFNWNDIPVKDALHNRRMVGITTWHAFFQRTRLTLHGKKVLVIGYGPAGRGVAESARAYGGCVSVAEIDPVRAREAAFTGWEVVSLTEGVAAADVIVTVAGVPSVIGKKLFGSLKDGAFLLNAGHGSDEIDVQALLSYPHKEVLDCVDAIELGSATVYLFAKGAMANLAAGYGDSLNAFDIILAVLAEGIAYMVGPGSQASAGVHLLPASAWNKTLV